MVHVFAYHVKPTSLSPEYGKVGGAYVDIWVNHPHRDEAEAQALSHLMDLGWRVIEMTHALEIGDAQIRDYRPDAQANYRQAIAQGLSATFVAYPPEDQDDDSVLIRPLGKPPSPSGIKH